MKVIYRFSDAAQKGKHGEALNKARYRNFNKRAIIKHFIDTFGVDKSNITVIADNTTDESYDYLTSLLPKEQVIRIDVKSGAFSFLYAAKYAMDNYTGDTVVYLVEDDYLHLPGSASILMEPFERFHEISYATLYDHPDKYMPSWQGGKNGENTRVIRSNSVHWKYTAYTTMTFACRVRTMREDFDKYNYYCHTGYPNDIELFQDLTRSKVLVNCIPGYSTHYEAGWYSIGVHWDSIMDSLI